MVGLLTALLGPVAAHVVPYAGYVPCPLPDGFEGSGTAIPVGSCATPMACPEDPNAEPLGIVGLGFACFPAYHLNLAETGLAYLSIWDDAWGEDTLAVACQDLDADGICGEIGEPRKAFCGMTTISMEELFTDEAALVVYPAASGNLPAIPVCHGLLLVPSLGSVYHE